ncbi:uncharacterized protein TRIADDRAFT_60196 [Trichoplax adhaerens]|uniref:Uncharacterized protein n=1 Tax=Trichoplax adhaerens TaxID=10228 RepID=B3S7K2_TRIAD|nr:predicted protein [Trichoplax adhaerens]EDV21211.1 predicted protein [Trichoplax adhaerens]|eukprot:XP_002116178.1 predicted protein [Trichoplax adhaerens]
MNEKVKLKSCDYDYEANGSPKKKSNFEIISITNNYCQSRRQSLLDDDTDEIDGGFRGKGNIQFSKSLIKRQSVNNCNNIQEEASNDKVSNHRTESTCSLAVSKNTHNSAVISDVADSATSTSRFRIARQYNLSERGRWTCRDYISNEIKTGKKLHNDRLMNAKEECNYKTIQNTNNGNSSLYHSDDLSLESRRTLPENTTVNLSKNVPSLVPKTNSTLDRALTTTASTNIANASINNNDPLANQSSPKESVNYFKTNIIKHGQLNLGRRSEQPGMFRPIQDKNGLSPTNIDIMHYQQYDLGSPNDFPRTINSPLEESLIFRNSPQHFSPHHHHQYQISNHDHYHTIAGIVEEQLHRVITPLYEAIDYQVQEIMKLKDEVKLSRTDHLVASEIALLRAEIDSLTKVLR